MKVTRHGQHLWQLTQMFVFNVSGHMRIMFPFPALATWHLPTALKSAIVLRELEPTHLAVGHGKMLDNPLNEMDRAIARAKAAIREVA